MALAGLVPLVSLLLVLVLRALLAPAVTSSAAVVSLVAV